VVHDAWEMSVTAENQAIDRILSLSEEELNRGAVSASTENYPLAIAEAMLADTCAGCVDQEVFKKIIA